MRVDVCSDFTTQKTHNEYKRQTVLHSQKESLGGQVKRGVIRSYKGKPGVRDDNDNAVADYISPSFGTWLQGNSFLTQFARLCFPVAWVSFALGFFKIHTTYKTTYGLELENQLYLQATNTVSFTTFSFLSVSSRY